MDYRLISPRSGRELRPAGPHLLTDGETLWPVVDGIPFLRDREPLRSAVVKDLRADDVRAARRRLLTDQDRFSPTPPPGDDQIDRLLEAPETSLRQAMTLLNYGPVGDYFAYRWCSPTFGGGLHLLERTPAGAPVVEIACGIGHFLRALETAGRSVIGVDIVWSKLWLARHYLDVSRPLVCGDIEAGTVLQVSGPATVFCHDAFYFFERKRAALQHMRALAGGGSLAIGHVHTNASGHGAGYAISRADYGELTPATVRDDAEFVAGWYGRSPVANNEDPTAVGWVEGEGKITPVNWFGEANPIPNPLLCPGGTVRWPSSEWEREYAEDAACLGEYAYAALIDRTPPTDRRELFRQRRLLNLPAKW